MVATSLPFPRPVVRQIVGEVASYEEVLAGLTALWRDMVKEETGKPPENPLAWVVETVNLIASDYYVCFVAEVDEQIIGFIDFYIATDPIQGDTVAHARHLFVKVEYRNTGISRALLLRSLRTMKKSGCSRMKFQSSPARVEQYQRAGFRPVAVILERRQ